MSAKSLVGGVRLRTTLYATLAVGLALSLGGVALVVATRASQTSSVRTTVETRAQDIAVLIRDDALPSPLPGRGEALETQVISETGGILASTPGLDDEGPLSSVRLEAGAVFEEIKTSNSDLSGQEGHVDADRILIHGLGVDGPLGPVTIVVAASLEPVEDATAALVPILLVVLSSLLIIIAGLVWLLTGHALTPVEAIRARAESIDAEDLDLRVPVPETNDEIERLARTMNDMLDRLEVSAQARQRFVADASHELRSPVAAMRTMLEVAQRHPGSVDPKTLVDDLLREDLRLESLTGDLLTLARHDERALRLNKDSVDVCAVLADEVTAARARSDVDIRLQSDHAVTTVGDRDKLVQVVRNLLDNGLRHAVDTVWTSCTSDGSTALLRISDDGDGVPIEDREAVFERFVRLDDARSRAAGGTGLGLAVCRALVEAHGGSVECVDSEHPGATFEVTLPRRTE